MRTIFAAVLIGWFAHLGLESGRGPKPGAYVSKGERYYEDRC